METSSTQSQAEVRIFISYRREEGGGHAAHLSADLGRHFGRDHVFRDIDDLEPGLDYEDAIDKAVGSADVLLAVIGRQWLTVVDEEGRRRIDDPEDLLRMELEAALKSKKRVIPVLVDGAKMPAKKDLPDELAPLRRRHAHVLSNDTWGPSIQNLVEAIERIKSPAEGPRDMGIETDHAAVDVTDEAETRADGEREEQAVEPIPEPEPEPEPTPGPPTVGGTPSRPLTELFDAAGLQYVTAEGGALAVPFSGGQSGQLIVQAREFEAADIAFFGIDIPEPGRFGREQALHWLLRASYLSNYTKAMSQRGDVILAAELPRGLLTPEVAGGLIRSLSNLGDVRRQDLSDDGSWQRRLSECLAAQQAHFQVDLGSAREAVPTMLREAGLVSEQVQEDMFMTRIDLAGRELKLGIRLLPMVISFVMGFGDSKPTGDKKAYMNRMLELNQTANVAKMGLDNEDDVALLYEVPRLFPGVLDRVRDQFTQLVPGLLALQTGSG